MLLKCRSDLAHEFTFTLGKLKRFHGMDHPLLCCRMGTTAARSILTDFIKESANLQYSPKLERLAALVFLVYFDGRISYRIEVTPSS